MKCLKTAKKLWGKEEWLVNEPEYCAKYLWITPHTRSSLHFHNVKKETFVVVMGAVELEVHPINNGGDVKFITLKEGDSYTLDPQVPHRFRTIPYTMPGTPPVQVISSACVLEVSTHHSDDDVERVTPSEGSSKRD